MKRIGFLLIWLFLVSLLGGATSAAGPNGTSSPDAAGAPPLSSTGEFTLRLGEFSFDPLEGEPSLPAGWDQSAAVGPDLHLVQFDGPIPAGALAALREGGLEPVQYIHPNTYVVWGRHEQRAGMLRQRSIRWTGDFAPAYRVQPQWRDLPDVPVDVQVLIYRGTDPDAVVAAISALGGTLTTRRVVHDRLEVAGFRLPGDRIRAAASIPGVYSVQVRANDGGSRAEVSAQINAGNVDVLNLAFPGYQAWLSSVGLDGSGVAVSNVDEGVDETHPDLVSNMLSCTGSTCAPGSSYHGTHTAGIIAGDGTSGTLDSNGFLRGLGVAPGAGLIEQYYAPIMAGTADMLDAMADAYNNGAQVSSNSWGPSGNPRGYDANTLLVDAGVRDADLDTPGSQPLIYVQAINNGNGGTSSQGTPDDAKNILTIGSTYAVKPDGNPDTRINEISSNSAHGPARDGRTIPHMVAPGCLVDSTYPDLGQGHDYHTQCGTSMAAPQVAGAVALFIEYYRGLPGYTSDPSPALVKAALLPVAHDLDGNKDADGVTMGHRPDDKQGWGRLNLEALVDPPAGSVLYFDQPTVFDSTGREWMRVVTADDPGQPMRVMLAWTDAPGHGLGGTTPAWNNDLDLIVDAAGQTYLGNDIGADGFSTTGGSADAMNNSEGVFLPSVSGNVTLRVSAANINSNGVPYVGDDTDQDFALVCYNCALVPDFALSADPISQGICAPESATFTLDVEQLAGFGDPVTLSTTGLPAGATESFTVNPVSPGGSSVLTIDPATAAAGDYTIQVQGDSTTLSRSVSVGLRINTGAPAPAVLTSPLDAAIDVHPQAVLEWDPLSLISHYLVEVAKDPGFLEIVYSAVEEGTVHNVGVTLEQQQLYYWRVRATNACGFGSVSATWSFTTVDLPDLLLVDDDYDVPNEQPEYTSALNSLGVTYDVWDIWAVHAQAEPGSWNLAPYDRVIWFTGKEENYAGPTADSEEALAGWLDGAGCLLISSQDYVLVRGFSDFMQNRLGVASVTEDTGQNQVIGQGSVFGGLGPYTLQNVVDDYRDSVTPDATAELAFDGDIGPAGVDKDGGWYRTSFLGFGVESTGVSDKPQILDAFLDWCDGLAAVDGDSDGVINGDDCAPGDAGAWAAPSPVTDLTMAKGTVGFSWSQPVSGSGAIYDLLRSDSPTDFYNATCVAAGLDQTSAPPDDDDPEPGELFYYLVGASNDCGLSTLGINLDGSPRYGTACDRSKQWW